jgi:hypothetical protein
MSYKPDLPGSPCYWCSGTGKVWPKNEKTCSGCAGTGKTPNRGPLDAGPAAVGASVEREPQGRPLSPRPPAAAGVPLDIQADNLGGET